MATTPSNWTRSQDRPATSGGDLALSLLLHAAVLGGLVGAALLNLHGKSWGDSSPTAGAIQAEMVSSIPLPTKAPTNEQNVLASENTSVAPVVTKETTPPPPDPRDIPVVRPEVKPVKPVVNAPVAPPVKHVVVPPPPANRAQTGEAPPSTRIAQSMQTVKNGSASMTVQDRNFGARFAYYVDAVNRRVTQNWMTGDVDARVSEGKHVTVLFDIDHDGNASNVRIETRSGSPTLDVSATRAVQRVDGFGPLPGGGDHITVEFTFDYKAQ